MNIEDILTTLMNIYANQEGLKIKFKILEKEK